MNPLYGYGAPQQTPFGNMMQFMQKFNQFRQSFQGNPQQQVQQLLSSGRMTREQFKQYKAQAEQMLSMFR